MSLTGNLEDLPLLDIIQIVSFSKKTGFLTIRTASGEAAIVFRDGFVVSSFTWDSLPPDPRASLLPTDKREAMIRARIAMALEQLIRLREGQFSFSLTAELPSTVGSREISGETLGEGINPQELLLELARGMDEDRRDSSAALEASFAEPEPEELPAAEATSADATVAAPEATVAVPEAAATAEASPASAAQPSGAEARRTILLVDDEADTRGNLRQHFTAGGYEVVEAEDPDAAVKAAQGLSRSGVGFVLVTDLGMPTSGGSSFQGGFEVVKRLGKMKLSPPVLMMTDRLSASLRARARQMGVSSFVFKPGLSKLDSDQFQADLKAFATKLLADVLPRLARGGPSPPPSSKPAREPSGRRKGAGGTDVSREMQILQTRLAELRSLGDLSQISQLVMKMARDFFERAILFLVKEEQVRGLGGFGPGPEGESLALLVRDIAIPLSERSAFLEVVGEHRTRTGNLPGGPWTERLYDTIGRFRSGEVALIPLLTHREVTAILFGDNPVSGAELGRMDVLEVFINQAGVALENAFLQRKLRSMQAEA